MGKTVNNEGKNRAKAKYPEDLDLSNLEYLERRDLTRVAKDLKQTPDYVSKIKNLVCKNSEVMAALLKTGGERRKKLQTAATL